MAKLCIVFAAICFALASPIAVAAKSSDAATVNGIPVPQSDVDALVTARVAQGVRDTPELREHLRDYLIKRELLAQEAIRRGIESDPEFATQLTLTKQSLLVKELLQQYGKKNEPTEKELKAEYNRYKKAMGSKEYITRHILVKDEKEAKHVVSRLREGADFTAIAKEQSIEPSLKKTDGVVDWAAASEFVQPISEALAHLKKGQYTEQPVHSTFGWHVVKIEDERPLEFPPFEQVKGNLRQTLQQEKVQKLIADLRGKATIEEPKTEQ
jgi:Parvulin-like peptidyl-prolyl isomerase